MLLNNNSYKNNDNNDILYQNYHKYLKKSNPNILMNNLQIDSGYPQQILSVKSTIQKDLNYIEDNKKNLKNFFKDRIPQDIINKYNYKNINKKVKNKDKIILDPTRIFEIKRQQLELKNQTKITLNKSLLQKRQFSSINTSVLNNKILDNSQPKTTRSTNIKLNQNFYINDKTLELKQKYNIVQPGRIDSYSRDNHRRGTHSFAEKRSKIIKKQAYQKVFGPDISSISRAIPVGGTPDLRSKKYQNQIRIQESQNDVKNKNKSMNLSRKKSVTFKNNHDKQMNMSNKREQLSKLIKKIDYYKNKIKPVKLDYQQDKPSAQQKTKQKQKNHSIQQIYLAKQNRLTNNSYSNTQSKQDIFSQQKKQKKQQLLQSMKNITHMYKGYAIQNTRDKLLTIDDLKIVDKRFYEELKNHKQNRLQKRLFQLYKYNKGSDNKDKLNNDEQNDEVNQINFQSNSHKSNKSKHQYSYERSEILTISVNDMIQDNRQEFLSQEEQFSPLITKKRKTALQRLHALGKNLISAVFYSDIYSIPYKFIYEAFWQNRKQYQMQGSYALFKAIKKNDLNCVKSFMNIDLNYLYQIQNNGRTPLIYAIYYNHQQIAQYLISLGSNIGKMDSSRKNALYYAIKNKNIDLVRLLLQYGAHPWSSEQLPFQKMLKHANNQKLNLLFSNAKKIFLGVRLQLNNQKRGEFWHKVKNKINQNQKIQF